MLNIALNGFGRIGKSLARVMLLDHQFTKKVRIKVINVGSADRNTVAYALKYDSIMGMMPHELQVVDTMLYGFGEPIQLIAQKEITIDLWKSLGIDWVVDVSGHYTTRERALEHLHAGARGVIISAPAEGDDTTIIMGVNDGSFDIALHRIVSLGSCTTNAVIPVIDVLQQYTKIRSLCMTTVHAYTNSQALLDGIGSSSDVRRTRAAAMNIVPSDTGALKVVKRLYPHIPTLGASLRVPVPVVSIIDLVVEMHDAPSAKEMMQWFHDAAKGRMQHIMAVNHEPLVSSDFEGTTYSTIVDATLSDVMGNMGKVMSWYDNEYGYCARVRDFILQRIA